MSRPKTATHERPRPIFNDRESSLDLLKDLDYVKIVLWVVPGALFAMTRSFALRGRFPSLGKDDVAALILGSVVYRLALSIIVPIDWLRHFAFPGWSSSAFWTGLLIVAPCAIGLFAGFFEASDVTGRAFRRAGLSVPTPTPTAWDTIFRTLPINTVMIVTLKSDAKVYGRWANDSFVSSASTDVDHRDLFIAEIGLLDEQRRYVPHRPKRGIYIAADEIRTIEII